MMRAMTSPHTIILYGIPNCDTVKKSRTWFTEQGLDYVFHDFKKQGVPAARLPDWLAAVGRDRLVNRQGTTWRKLDADTQAAVQDDASASTLLQAQPSVVKRPVVEWSQGGTTRISVGFAPETWNEWRQGSSNP